MEKHRQNQEDDYQFILIGIKFGADGIEEEKAEDEKGGIDRGNICCLGLKAQFSKIVGEPKNNQNFIGA